MGIFVYHFDPYRHIPEMRPSRTPSRSNPHSEPSRRMPAPNPHFQPPHRVHTRTPTPNPHTEPLRAYTKPRATTPRRTHTHLLAKPFPMHTELNLHARRCSPAYNTFYHFRAVRQMTTGVLQQSCLFPTGAHWKLYNFKTCRANGHNCFEAVMLVSHRGTQEIVSF